jgi:hypothetical protein
MATVRYKFLRTNDPNNRKGYDVVPEAQWHLYAAKELRDQAPSRPKVRVGQVWKRHAPCDGPGGLTFTVAELLDLTEQTQSARARGEAGHTFWIDDAGFFSTPALYTFISDAPPPAPVVKVGQVWRHGDNPTDYAVEWVERQRGIAVLGGLLMPLNEDGSLHVKDWTLVSGAPCAPVARKVQVGDVWRLDGAGVEQQARWIGLRDGVFAAWFDVGYGGVPLNQDGTVMRPDCWTLVRAADEAPEPDYSHDATHLSPEQFDRAADAVRLACVPVSPTKAELHESNSKAAASMLELENTPRWALDGFGRRQGPTNEKYTRTVLGQLDSYNFGMLKLTGDVVRWATETEEDADRTLAYLAGEKDGGFLIECDTRNLEM